MLLPINRKSRRELTVENKRIRTRIGWVEKHIYGIILDDDYSMLPPPPRETISKRIELLEAKMDLIIEHLGLEVKSQPHAIKLKKRNKNHI
jgi:hypothetical protein